MSTVIDAHAHLWSADDGFHEWLTEPGLEDINSTFTADELVSCSDRAGVSKVILVEGGTPSGQDTPMLIDCAQRVSQFAGVVAWTDLLDGGLSASVSDHVIGFRTQVQGQPDDYVDRADVRDGLRRVGRSGYPFELVLRPSQWSGVLALIDYCSGTRFVIDHVGNPEFEDGRPREEWVRWMSQVGERQNVDVKLSGLPKITGTVTQAALTEVIEVALESFGTARIAWGSDWPMSLLHRSYPATLRSARTALTNLSLDEQADVFGNTAQRIYRLGSA